MNDQQWKYPQKSLWVRPLQLFTGNLWRLKLICNQKCGQLVVNIHIVLCSIDQHTLCGLDHGVGMLHENCAFLWLDKVRGYTSPQDFLNDRYGTLRLRLLCAVCGVIPIISSWTTLLLVGMRVCLEMVHTAVIPCPIQSGKCDDPLKEQSVGLSCRRIQLNGWFLLWGEQGQPFFCCWNLLKSPFSSENVVKRLNPILIIFVLANRVCAVYISIL